MEKLAAYFCKQKCISASSVSKEDAEDTIRNAIKMGYIKFDISILYMRDLCGKICSAGDYFSNSDLSVKVIKSDRMISGAFIDNPVVVFDYEMDSERPSRKMRLEICSRLLGIDLDCLGYVCRTGFYEDILCDEIGRIYVADFDHEQIHFVAVSLHDYLCKICRGDYHVYLKDHLEIKYIFEFDHDASGYYLIDRDEQKRRRAIANHSDS